MSAKPQTDPADQPVTPLTAKDGTGRVALPFEPTKSRKKAAETSKLGQVQPNQPKSTPRKPSPDALKQGGSKRGSSKDERETTQKVTQPQAIPREEMGIPEVVSRRMVSRMTLFCGLPSLGGILVFLVSYTLVSHDWLKLPPIAVLLLSLGCFGLGVVGLSYGALSASWEEDVPGSRLGRAEFATNLERMTSAWRSKGKAPQD